MNILIVDDSKFTRNLLAASLTKMAYQVTSADGPHEAMAKIEKHRPDLIITDLKMPSLMDGLGFIKMLSLEVRDIPVFVYTADANAASTVGETGLDYVRFIQKPVAAQLLQNEIVAVLGEPR